MQYICRDRCEICSSEFSNDNHVGDGYPVCSDCVSRKKFKRNIYNVKFGRLHERQSNVDCKRNPKLKR